MIKCIVWDLDETLWDGTLTEGDDLRVRQNVVEVINYLDKRGIIHSIASRNDFELALGKLRQLNLLDYFLCPQIHWGSKSESISRIARKLNLAMTSIAFVDDDPYELMEVSKSHPEILCFSFTTNNELIKNLGLEEVSTSDEAKVRRQLYREEFHRQDAADVYEGPNELFLESLNMEFEIRTATMKDLTRAVELTNRTNQLNSTGYTYSIEELAHFVRSNEHMLLIGSLRDRFGDYGKVSLVLIERSKSSWNLKLLLISCRVLSRGIGSVLLNFIIEKSISFGIELLAEFRKTSVNRIMYVTYKFAGFYERERGHDRILFQYSGKTHWKLPSFIRIIDRIANTDIS